MNPSFKPSQVHISQGGLPLIGTMGRAEVEAAAALIVCTCIDLGDEWQPVSPKQIGDMLKKTIETKLGALWHLNGNPFFRPDAHDLVARGYAAWEGKAGTSPISFTDKGFEALAKWVR